MAYAAVISLKNTIQRLLKLCATSFESSGRKILESAYEEVVSLQKVVERFDSCNSDSSERMKVLGGRIRDEVYKFEDAIDSCYHSKRVVSQSESRELEELRQALKRFTLTVEKIKETYVEESDNLLAKQDNEEEEAADFGGTEMGGSHVQFHEIRDQVTDRNRSLTAKAEEVQRKENKIAHAAVISLKNTIQRLLKLYGKTEEVQRKEKMAYAAVISLKNTIQRLLKLCGISFESSGRKILESAFEEVVSLQKVVERFDSCNSDSSERMKVLGGQIRDEVYKFEDAIDSCHHSKRVVSQSESRELEELRQALKRFTQTVEKIKEMYVEESDNLLAEENNEEEEDAADFGVTEMVGSSVQFQALRTKIINRHWSLPGMTLIGMAGMGKTTLAKKIFEDELVTRYFDCRAFVKVGQKPRMRKVLLSVLAQVNRISDGVLMLGDEELDKYFLQSLTDRKYLIVLDDVWDANLFSELRKRLPYEYGTSLLFVTTRLKSVAESVPGSYTYNMRFLNEEESWDLLRKKVFAGGFCPPLLEIAGRKIAENCEGLPLLILKVADLLSQAEKTLEYWNKIAADKGNPIFTDACDQISEVLYPSYNYLPQHLKACFLYMGAFCRIYDIRCSKLFNLWIAEGILEPHSCQSLEEFARNCLTELISCNVVLECEWAIKDMFRVKTCRLHSVFWHLCKREAGSNKFLLILNRPADILAEGIVSQRRLSIYNNIILSIKKVYESMLSIENARSLLCTGSHHQYGVPICSGLRLLRVLDALTIRLYEFPIEVVELVQLRYLSLTCDGKIPPSISKLWSLQYLIILQHIGIKHTLAQSYLPTEIWELQELKYLQVVGRNLPDPCGAALPNLTTLLDVGPYSCDESVLQSIPKLKKLRVRIELTPSDVEYSSSFDSIPHLGSLQSLQYVIVNPQLGPDIVAPSLHLHVFTSCLQKLTLSGLGYPWKDIQKISKLPFLIMLKLRCYAFRGEEWEVKNEEFETLKHLLIEDSDLVQWSVWERAFPSIETVIIKNCYKLQAIPSRLDRPFIVLDDCSPLAVHRAEEDALCFVSKSSWDDGSHSRETVLQYKEEERIRRAWKLSVVHYLAEKEIVNTK